MVDAKKGMEIMVGVAANSGFHVIFCWNETWV
jgi:hypothetical protein